MKETLILTALAFLLPAGITMLAVASVTEKEVDGDPRATKSTTLSIDSATSPIANEYPRQGQV